MRVLITGITGFVGPHLTEYLFASQPDVEVWGLAFGEEGRDVVASLQPRLRVVEGDLTDPVSLTAALDEARPDIMFHLAAASSVGASWSHPAMVLEVNLIGQVNLFEAACGLGLTPLTVVASSGEIYGKPAVTDVGFREDAALRPQSPYATSKAAQDLAAFQYHVAGKLPTVRLRLFNHTGPRQLSNFVASSIAFRLAEIEHGTRPPVLEMGNLDIFRDFTDVRDVVRAYWAAARHGEPGAAYNVCSGKAISIREILDRLVVLSHVKVEVRQDPKFLRAADIPVLFGDHSSLTSVTGWKPEIPLDTTLSDLLDWWRERV